MDMINLSKNEKVVLRLVASGEDCPDTFPINIFVGCIRSLERKGLVKGAYVEGGGVEAARLTPEGRCLLSENPNLSNGINWKSVIDTTLWAIGAIGGLAGFIALLRTCN